MKKILISIFLVIGLVFSVVNLLEAKVSSVRGYFRSSGTYVQPYYRTSPNSTRFDNYSTKGNYNPFTGKKGYISPFKLFR